MALAYHQRVCLKWGVLWPPKVPLHKTLVLVRFPKKRLRLIKALALLTLRRQVCMLVDL